MLQLKAKEYTKGVDVVDLQWDPLSSVYILVAYKNGSIALWDADMEDELQRFDRKGAGLRALVWMPWSPGSFASVESRTSVMRIWNVSQRVPQEKVL